LVLAVFCGAMAAFAAPAAVASLGGNWPSFQGGPAHLGVAPDGTPGPALRAVGCAGSAKGSGTAAVAVAGEQAVAVEASAVVGYDLLALEVRHETCASRLQPAWSLKRAAGNAVAPVIDPAAGPHGVLVYVEGRTSGDSAVVAIDLTNRAEVWRHRLNGPVRAPLALDGDKVVMGGSDGFVYLIDANTGAIIWKHSVGAPVDAAPAAADGRVVAVSENATTGRATLTAMDETDGRVTWSHDFVSGLGSSAPSISGGLVFAGFGDLSVRAFRLDTGVQAWTRSQPVRDLFSFLTSPAVAGNALYLADRRGGVYRFDTRTGKRQWDYQFTQDILWSAPLVAGLDTATGNLRWRDTFDLGPVGALAPAGSVLLAPGVGSNGGILVLAHDPFGSLLDQESPTHLHLPLALAAYGGAFVVMLGAILGLFLLVERRSGRPTVPGVPLLGLEEPNAGDPSTEGDAT
jgi:outer membrane protein assembly factor BamB